MSLASTAGFAHEIHSAGKIVCMLRDQQTVCENKSPVKNGLTGQANLPNIDGKRLVQVQFGMQPLRPNDGSGVADYG